MLNQPWEYVSGRDGVSRKIFDYFPEHHYEQGFEQLRSDVSDSTLDEWMNQVVGHEPVGASHGGLWRDDIPQLVADILTNNPRYETEITIKPEPRPDGYDYTVEWKRVSFDREAAEWTPVADLPDDYDT